VVQERRRHLYGGRRGVWFEGFICASPWLVGFLVFGAGPIVFSIVISFSHYDVLSPARFVGWQNYMNLLGSHVDAITGERTWNDPLFWKSLQNTAYMIVGVPLGILAGLALALLLDSKVRGLHVYRTIYYLPAIVPAVASFILWIWILSPSSGFLNRALMLLGFDNPPNWLQDPLWSKPALILMGLWGVGGSMLIWLAGLKDIPQSMYEAAAIDGANRFQRFLHITIPLLSPYILFNMIMGMIGVFQIFEAAFIMTDGGPADSTLFYAYKLFNEAFRFLNMGVASAMAWVLFVVVLVITLIQLWLSKKWVHYGGQ
jgi:multiple sugar transport system permease protein